MKTKILYSLYTCILSTICVYCRLILYSLLTLTAMILLLSDEISELTSAGDHSACDRPKACLYHNGCE